MNGISQNGVTLFLGKLPGRKQACFYFLFLEESSIYPVAFVSSKHLIMAHRLWAKMLSEKAPEVEVKV